MSNAKKIIMFSAITLVALVVLVSARNLTDGKEVPITGNAVLELASSGEVQNVAVRMQGSRYVMEPSVLKKGSTVRLEFDMGTVYGCMRDVRIPQFGVSKYLSESDNIVEFVPDATGEFKIACSMNMGQGVFSVVESDASSSEVKLSAASVQKAAADIPATGGGCGCGGGAGGTCGGGL